jgi:outer membrane cobalamin receptor
VTRADIEARNARSLDEALRLLPGIHVRTGGDGSPRIDVRGFRSRHVLLLVNGVQVNSTADGQFDPARISTAGIREIKVTYGSSSILYGDNALAAVIEITTMDTGSEAVAEASIGTPDQQEASGRYARSADRWSVSASATAFGTDGYRLPEAFAPRTLEDGGRRENSDRVRNDVRAAFGYRISPGVSLSSEWTFGTGHYGVPGSVINDPADAFAPNPRFERVEDYQSGSGQISTELAPAPRINVRAWVYRNAQREDRARYDDATYSSMDDPLVQGTFQSRERTTVTGSSALTRIALTRIGWLRLAANQRREAFESRGTIRDVATGGSAGGGGGGGGGGRGGGGGSAPATFGTRDSSLDHHVDVYSAGAEWEWRVTQRLGTVLGAGINAQQRPSQAAHSAPTWIAGLVYDLSASLKLHASATRKIRVPSIDQLFNASTGNPQLRVEHAHGFDTGADYRLDPTTTVSVSAFVTQATDFIERVGNGPFENQERYRFRGTELTVQTARIPQLTLRGTYSFLDSDDLRTASPEPLQTRPRHRGSLEWIWKPVETSIVRGAAYWTGAQLFDSRGNDPVQMRVDGFGLVDGGYTQTVAGRYDIAFDVTNLFDRLYEQAYALPREGRAAVLTLRTRIR